MLKRKFVLDDLVKILCGTVIIEVPRSSRWQMFFKIGFLKKFAIFTGKHLCLESLFNKVAGLQRYNFIKKKLQHRIFPVNIAKFLRTVLFIEHLWWLLLSPIGCSASLQD